MLSKIYTCWLTGWNNYVHTLFQIQKKCNNKPQKIQGYCLVVHFCNDIMEF